MTNDITEQHVAFEPEKLKSDDSGVAQSMERHCVALAEAGNVDAAAALSAAYNDGYRCIRKDAIKAYRYTARAADLGSSFSRYWLAKLQRDSGDFTNAIVNVKLASANGESAATVLLADMLLRGQGCAPAPMEALDMLARAAEGSDSDAALALARHLLKGEFIPRDPTRAYEILSSHDVQLELLELISPGTEAQFLYLKACALREGAQVSGAPDWSALMRRAADAGHEAAKAEVHSIEAARETAAWRKQWDALAVFRAYGIEWEMFFVTGTLRQTEHQSASSVGSVGNVVTTHTARWKESVFDVMGSPRKVKFETNADLVGNQQYHLLYCGKRGSETGVPLMVMNCKTHDVIPPTGGLKNNYPNETSNGMCKFFLAILIPFIIGLWFMNVVLGVLGAVAWVVLAVRCTTAQSDKVNEAVAGALKHLATLR